MVAPVVTVVEPAVARRAAGVTSFSMVTVTSIQVFCGSTIVTLLHVYLRGTVVEHTAQLSQLHAVVSAFNLPAVLTGRAEVEALRTSNGQERR